VAGCYASVTSTVTVLLLRLIADVMSAQGSLSAGELLLVLACPGHTELLRRQRWSCTKVQEFLTPMRVGTRRAPASSRPVRRAIP
jgi:hypothetical protein